MEEDEIEQLIDKRMSNFWKVIALFLIGIIFGLLFL